jgi:class 3 adenylate cyclase
VPVADADVAYQIVGEGPTDLLLPCGLGCHVDWNWELPAFSKYMDRLACFFRVIIFDRRGTGASDGVPRNAVPTIEDWTDDIAAVLDATNSQRASVLALADTGPIAIMYAAMHPERVRALALVNASARAIRADDYPVGVPQHVADRRVSEIASTWGTTQYAALLNPHATPEYLEISARVLRASTTPRTAAAQYRANLRSDVRDVLPLVRVPTLVLQSKDHPLFSVERGRYLAEHIEGATLIEVPGPDLTMTLTTAVVDEIAAFLTGERPTPPVDRILTTVLFTDIVASTERLVAVGDRDWREQLDAHDAAVRAQLDRFDGREIGTEGDSFFATFDGPARAIHCAQAIIREAAALGVDVRAGVHTGECEVRGDDLGGIAVHIGSRVSALAAGGQVLTTRTVKDLVEGSGIAFADHGVHELKGIPDRWHLYEVLT